LDFRQPDKTFTSSYLRKNTSAKQQLLHLPVNKYRPGNEILLLYIVVVCFGLSSIGCRFWLLTPILVFNPSLLVVAKCKLSIVGHCCCSFLLVADGRVLVVWYWLLNDDKKFVSVASSA
jgi:hypothetical protein